jgi:integrative and conjugative element protein (TIGR02256 family)
MCVEESHTPFRSFRFNKESQRVEISQPVLDLFAQHQQHSPAANEAGGLLFADVTHSAIRVLSATAPSGADQRGRFFFRPNRRRAKSEIKRRFEEGLHFVGEWHTHPERCPSPSKVDLDSMSEAFMKSKHKLDYFIMIIVGNDHVDMKLSVSLHDGIKPLKMTEEEEEEHIPSRPL